MNKDKKGLQFYVQIGFGYFLTKLRKNADGLQFFQLAQMSEQNF